MMPEYYFAVYEMAEDEDGSLCDAYMKIDFPIETTPDVVMEYAASVMPSLKGKMRPVSREEYDGNEEGDG